MGVSSFKTADKQESVVLNNYDHPNSNRTVYFLLPGADHKIAEPSYDGYARFGNIDAFEWLAKINGVGESRDDGIELFYDDEKYETIKYPIKLSYNPDAKYDDIDGRSYSCPDQGLPPHPRMQKALDRGLHQALAESLSPAFDLEMDDVLDYALLFTKVTKVQRSNVVEPDNRIDEIINTGKELNISIQPDGAQALIELAKNSYYGMIDHFDFSEIMANPSIKHNSYVDDPEYDDLNVSEPPRPKM